MLRFSSRWLLGALVGLAGGALFAAAPSCAVDAASAGDYGGAGVGGSGTTGSGIGGDASVITPDGDTPPKRVNYAALCGLGSCTPGPDSLVGCQGGAGGGSSSSSSSGSGGTSQGAGGAGSALGCQVSPTGSSPTSVCAPIGGGAANAPCQSSADCGPGLGCAADTNGGVALCRPYCCGDFEECPTSTYCAKAPMVENPARDIPVCVAISPCQALTDGACPADQTCSIVRADGTTSCVPKGTGQFCEACPCAAGFTCSAIGVCQKLCHTGQPNGECGAGTCQGGSMNLPTGIGLCVGGDADCSHKL